MCRDFRAVFGMCSCCLRLNRAHHGRVHLLRGHSFIWWEVGSVLAASSEVVLLRRRAFCRVLPVQQSSSLKKSGARRPYLGRNFTASTPVGCCLGANSLDSRCCVHRRRQADTINTACFCTSERNNLAPRSPWQPTHGVGTQRWQVSLSPND